MDLSRPEITYVLLVIPTLFALTIIGQGIGKMRREESDGPVALGFGVFILILIGAAYFLYIR